MNLLRKNINFKNKIGLLMIELFTRYTIHKNRNIKYAAAGEGNDPCTELEGALH